MSFQLTSPAFDYGETIPTVYTCDGEDRSPPLSWSGTPDGAKSLALLVDDPDAPDPEAPKMVWVHWVLYNLPPDLTGLAEAVEPNDLPPGTQVGLNDWKRRDYGGPCPPIGQHRYFFKLFALDSELPHLVKPSKKNLQESMRGHVLADAVLMGTYSREH
jgi:Raf kinase inhibitor-like YbhB/YbcL family protein